MKILKWLLGIIVVLALVILGFLFYMGMFSSLKVTETTSGPYIVAYERYVGPYQNTGKVFDKVYKELAAQGVTTVKGIGVYYDDPKTVAPDKCRSDCGVIIEAKDLPKVIGKQKVMRLPKMNVAVAEFPIRNMFSYMFGPIKAYPALTKYAAAKNLKTGMTFELYDMPANKIIFTVEIKK